MTTLRVVIDDMLDGSNLSLSRYSADLTRALVQTAPPNCFVEGIVAASTEQEYAELGERLPGLAGLYKSPLSRRELLRAWQHGFTSGPSHGLVHGTSLLAPMRRHDRLNSEDQVVVTVHDALAWTAPDAPAGRRPSWTRAMAKRAEKYADAVVVPTHSLAEELAEYADFGDRVRVIPPGVTAPAAAGAEADQRGSRGALPDTYILTLASAHAGLDPLLQALVTIDLPLVVVGRPEWRDASVNARLEELGIAESRVIFVPDDDPAESSKVLAGAAAFVDPAALPGSAGPILDAMAAGIPVVSADRPDARELAADSADYVSLDSPERYAEALAASLERLLGDTAERTRRSLLGHDRARVFTWAGAAEKVWQLHADL